MLIGRSVKPSSTHPWDTVRGMRSKPGWSLTCLFLTVYVIPPFINDYGQVHSVAELIASGDACLVSTGGASAIPADVTSLFQPRPSKFQRDTHEIAGLIGLDSHFSWYANK